MKNHIEVLLVILLVTGCSRQANTQNIDGLNQMADILNKELPKFKDLYDPMGFYIKDGQPVNFFVYNLIDTTGNDYPTKSPIKLNPNGVYHFSPVRYRFSYSHIAVIKNGELKIFGYLNCEGKGNDISDVMAYVNENFKYDEAVLNRIRNYRSHGKFFKMDPQSKVECP